MRSLAIPSSCIGQATCTSLQQATFSLYQICRAAILFGIDEIIVFQVPEPQDQPDKKKITFQESPVTKTIAWETRMAANLLQFFLTPKHLHKLIFNDLKPYKYARKLARIPGPHTSTKLVQGIAIRKHLDKKKTKKTKKEKADARVTPFINFGFDRAFQVEEQVPLYSRVAIDLKTREIKKDVKLGYVVRAVDEFSKIFTESTIPDGYTHTFYVPCQEFFKSAPPLSIPNVQGGAPTNSRLLLVVSDWQSLEGAVKADTQMEAEPAQLFDGMISGLEKARLEDATLVSFTRTFSL